MSVLDMGVSPDHMIYANPCKQVSHIMYAAKKGVDMVTFDNELELYKFHKHFPSAKWVKLGNDNRTKSVYTAFIFYVQNFTCSIT